MQRAIELTQEMRARIRLGRSGILCSVVVLLALSSVANAQSEDQIKAAFLFNFARYVEWPQAAFSEASSSVRICMIGAEDFAEVVSKTVSGKSVGDRPVEVESRGDLSTVSTCHILYVGDGVKSSPSDLASRIGDESVFTVSDRAGFATGGGIANFIRAENKVRFEINPTAAKKVGLKVSSRLLRLANVVK